MIAQLFVLLGRLTREPTVHTTAALATLPVASAGLHAVGMSTDLDTNSLAAGILSSSLWLTLGLAALFGALGGIVAELLSLHGKIELPHHARRHAGAKRSRLADPRYELDLGIFSRMLLGAAAGLALLSIYAPTSPTALLVNALIGGSAATGLFRLAQGRLLGREPAPANRQQPAASVQPSPAKLSVVG